MVMTSRILSRGSGHSRKWGISILLAWRSLNYPVMIRSISKDSAAKSLQSCPTLCDPIDGSPPGSSIAGILQARTPEWVAISFSNAWKWSHSVVSNSWRPHGLQPTRLLHPWDFLGKSTGVGCMACNIYFYCFFILWAIILPLLLVSKVIVQT